MSHNEGPSRILIADCGTATTIVLLIEASGEGYRLVSQAESLSTHQAPWYDLTVGVVDAINFLEKETGLRLINSQSGDLMTEHIHRAAGVDLLIVLTSAAQPLRVLLMGLTQQISLKQAKKAVTSTYTTISAQIALDNPLDSQSMTGVVKIIQQAQADVVLLVGGVDKGADAALMRLVHTLALALQMIEPPFRPAVVYAGNNRLRTTIANRLSSLTRFTSVDNILPTLETVNLGALQMDLAQQFVTHKLSQMPSARRISTWTPQALMPSAQSFAQTVAYFGQNFNVSTLGVDVGSTSTTLAISREQQQSVMIRTDIGVGHHATALLPMVSWDRFQDWIPVEISEADFQNFVFNKSLFPATIPQTQQEMWLEIALMRAALQVAYRQASEAWLEQEKYTTPWFSWDIIIGSGQMLARGVTPPLATLALLDGLQPTGICRLVLDRVGLTRTLGALAKSQPEIAAQLVEQARQFLAGGPLLNLGMVIAPVGLGQPGETALHLRITYADGRQEAVQVPFGTLKIIPLGTIEEARIEIRPARHLRIHSQAHRPGRAVNATINGGVLGIIIDARGRPLQLTNDRAARRHQLRDWLASLSPTQSPFELSPSEVEFHVSPEY